MELSWLTCVHNSRFYHYNKKKVVNFGLLSSIFALKESVIKALELPVDSWLEMEVVYKESGKTTINLSNMIKPKNLVSLDSSVL